MKSGEKTRNQEVLEGNKYPSILRTSKTEKTVRLTSQIQISNTVTPSHFNNSFCLNNMVSYIHHHAIHNAEEVVVDGGGIVDRGYQILK